MKLRYLFGSESNTRFQPGKKAIYIEREREIGTIVLNYILYLSLKPTYNQLNKPCSEFV